MCDVNNNEKTQMMEEKLYLEDNPEQTQQKRHFLQICITLGHRLLEHYQASKKARGKNSVTMYEKIRPNLLYTESYRISKSRTEGFKVACQQNFL